MNGCVGVYFLYAWLASVSSEHGIRGLSNKPGRGRKPGHKSPEEAESELLVAIGVDGSLNPHQTPWTLRSLGLSCRGLKVIASRHSSDLLTLGFSYKRARVCAQYPDSDYAEKLSNLSKRLEEARKTRKLAFVVYQDEFSFISQPTLAKGLGETGTK